MDFKIIAVINPCLCSSGPIPVENAVARFYHENKESIFKACSENRKVSVSIKYKTLHEGGSVEQGIRDFKISYHGKLGNFDEVCTLRNSNDEESKLFVDLNSGKDLIGI